MIYGVRPRQVWKIQNKPFAGVVQDLFLRIFENSQKYTCPSLFFNEVAGELPQNFMSNFLIE